MSGIPDAPKESDTEYDGFLSYAGEWHSAALGGGVGTTAGALIAAGQPVAGLMLLGGFTLMALRENQLAKKLGIKIPFTGNKKAMREVRREPWYGIGFSLIFCGIAVFGSDIASQIIAVIS